MGRAKFAGLIVEKSACSNPGDFSIAYRIIARWKQNLANGLQDEIREAPALKTAFDYIADDVGM